MGTPSKHSSSIVLDCCWVCAAKFISDGGTETREDHHVVPRAYGGIDGPTVTLCDSHHSKVHAIALCLIKAKPHFSFLREEPQERTKKLLYLANAIYNAELVMRNDPNKAAAAMIALNARHKSMVEDLKKCYPHARSREAIFLLALESLHKKHFISK